MKIIAKNSDKLIKFLIHNVQGLSFGKAQKMLRTGDIKVNNKRTKENINIVAGDEIDIYLKEKSKPQIEIIYEDDNILIVNKPAGMECATRDKSSENTYSLEEIFADKNAIVVHRLDRLTEGLVILAKSKNIAIEMEEIFRTRQIHKSYIAGVKGNCNLDGMYTAYLTKDSKNALVSISDKPSQNSKEIITEFHLKEKINDISIINVTLHTGRTHQIRAHLNYLGYPIVNDSKYGKDKAIINNKYSGYFLTAYKLTFEIGGKLKYLNEYQFETNPTWIQYV